MKKTMKKKKKKKAKQKKRTKKRKMEQRKSSRIRWEEGSIEGRRGRSDEGEILSRL